MNTTTQQERVKITLTNSKLGIIPQVNLPIISCRNDAPCKKGCYANKGTYLYSSVQKNLNNNLKALQNDFDLFFNDIINYVNNSDIIFKYFRWHSCGDIPNYKYLLGVIKVAEKCKNTKFLCYTKKFNLVNMYLALGKKLPKNLSIVFSGWDKNFIVDNPYNLPTTYVDFKDKTRNVEIPNKAFECQGSCKTCKMCWNLKSGQSVVFHQH